MRKTFLYKVRINQKTEKNCLNWLELCRTLYNLGLEQRILIHKQRKQYVISYNQIKQLPSLKAEFPEFKAVGSQVLQDVLERLDRAFKGFFRQWKNEEKPGFPRFKGKGRYDSFTLKQAGWQLSGRYLDIKNVGRFKLYLSRPIEGTIKTITIRRKSTGDWFVAFSCDNVPTKEFPMTNRDVGIDVGIKSFLVDSDGRIVENPKFFRQSEKLLRRRQRKLCRRKKGSNRRNKARILVSKAHEKITNQRKDFLHKTANYYVKEFNNIYIEDLKIHNMVKNKHLSKSIADSSWGMFFKLLTEKAEGAARQVIKVPPHNTSQICSICGEKVPKSLSVRTHDCHVCKTILDRDHNASLNILRLGQRLQTLTVELPAVV